MLRKLFRRKLAKKRRSHLTIMAIPTSGEAPRTISIPFLVLYVVLPLALAVVAFFIISYLEMTRGVITLLQIKTSKDAYIQQLLAEKEQLSTLKDRQQEQIELLTKKTDELADHLGDLEEERQRILSIIKGTKTTSSISSTASRGSGSERGGLPGSERALAAAVTVGRTDTRGGAPADQAAETLATVEALIESTQEMKERYGDLRRSAEAYRRKEDHTPSIWPVYGRISSYYGYRFHPIERATKFHEGIDIAVQPGMQIRAAAAGQVTYSGWKAGYGYMIEINHGYGYVTRYGHNSRLIVKRGQTVKKGQVIAYSGSTGLSTGPHLHYEVIVNGKPVNPTKYLR